MKVKYYKVAYCCCYHFDAKTMRQPEMNVGYFVASKAIISPLSKADRFLLVFRVHLVSSTI